MTLTNQKQLKTEVILVMENFSHIEHQDCDTSYISDYLLDLDLSILGKNPEEYRRYCDNIRKEYSIYPDFIYRKGRRKVLQNILELDSIYKTDFFKQAYEN